MVSGDINGNLFSSLNSSYIQISKLNRIPRINNESFPMVKPTGLITFRYNLIFITMRRSRYRCRCRVR